MIQTELELGYWALRALGEPARLILRQSGAEWKDAAIPLNDEGKALWFGDKKTNMGLDFPNLPYLIDGDVKVTQSVAVYRHLGRKFDLYPDLADQSRGDMFEQYIMDLRSGITKLCFQADFEETAKPAFIATLDLKLGELTKFIGAGPWVVGEKLTYLDFLGYEILQHLKALSPDHFKEGPLVDHAQRVRELPNLKKWFESEDCTDKTYTINAPFAVWPGKPS